MDLHTNLQTIFRRPFQAGPPLLGPIGIPICTGPWLTGPSCVIRYFYHFFNVSMRPWSFEFAMKCHTPYLIVAMVTSHRGTKCEKYVLFFFFHWSKGELPNKLKLINNRLAMRDEHLIVDSKILNRQINYRYSVIFRLKTPKTWS
jgi:hypothetical protein